MGRRTTTNGAALGATALVYRGVWRDDRSDLLESATSAVERWLGGRGLDVDQLSAAESPTGQAHLRIHRARSDGVSSVRALFVEPLDGGAVRQTTVTVLVQGPRDQHVCVDVEVQGTRAPLEAPRLVAHLLAGSVDARVGQVRLTPRPTVVSAASLAGLVGAPRRSMPIIAFSHDPAFDPSLTRARAELTLRRLLGAAQVVLLAPGDCDKLLDLLGSEAIAFGQAALYAPPTSCDRLERTRVVPAARLELSPELPSRLFAEMLRGAVTARPMPRSFDAVRKALRTVEGATPAELLRIAEGTVDKLRAERDGLKRQIAALESDFIDAQADLEAAVSEIDALQLQAVWSQVPGTATGDADRLLDLSETPMSLGQTVEWARRRLDKVVVHAEAAHDIDALDSAVTAPAWATMLWRGLRALHVYAEARFDGDFHSWCSRSGHPWAWSASDKKLAMVESETVTACDRFAEQRFLPVDPGVAEGGRVHMWAHLKIAQGGGPMAPRVYFYDDTRGSTGKVHVGFIGPHRYMENTKTN